MSDHQMLPTFDVSINNELSVRVQVEFKIKDAQQNLYQIEIRKVTGLEDGKDWTMWLDLNMVAGYLWGNNWIPKGVME